MNRLEQYIRENKSQFDQEPATGHFERLQQKMNRKSGRIVIVSWSISIAASIAILFFVGIMAQRAKKYDDNRIICENTIDMKSCYLNKMNAVAGNIETLTQKLDPIDRQQVMADVQDIINMANGNFESEIPQELPDNETKMILSDYYQYNLKNLKSIENRLKETLINYKIN